MRQIITSFLSHAKVHFKVILTDYYKKSEEKFEQGKKTEEELEIFKVESKKYQEQLKQLSDENDKTINLNNELKNKIAELAEKIVQKDQQEKEMEALKKIIEDKHKIIERLEMDIKTKEVLINDYDKKFEQFEEDQQNIFHNLKEAEAKKKKLEDLIEKQIKELDLIRKENESIALEKASQEHQFSQEKIELNKAAAIYEKKITHLVQVKTELEQKLTKEREKGGKIIKKSSIKEVQTEIIGGEKLDSALQIDSEFVEKLKQKLEQKEEEIHKAQNYANTLIQEMNKNKEKLGSTQTMILKLEKEIVEKNKIIGENLEEKKKLAEQNADLTKRRESAKTEINKLTQQIQRAGSRPPSEDSKRGKVGCHRSEAVKDSLVIKNRF